MPKIQFTKSELDEHFLKEAKRKGHTFDIFAGKIYDAKGKAMGCKTKNGGFMVSVYYCGKTYGINVARAIWLYANGPISDQYGVSHIDDKKTENFDGIENLELTTTSERSKKAIQKNSWKIKKKPTFSKITKEMVNEDRRFEKENPGSHEILAKKRGVSSTTMRLALRGVTWKDAEEPPVNITKLPRGSIKPIKRRSTEERPKRIRVRKPKNTKPKSENTLVEKIKIEKTKPPKTQTQLKPVRVSIPKPPKPVPYTDIRRVAKCFLLNNPHISNKGILRFLQMRAMDERISLPKFCAITTQIKQEIQHKRKN